MSTATGVFKQPVTPTQETLEAKPLPGRRQVKSDLDASRNVSQMIPGDRRYVLRDHVRLDKEGYFWLPPLVVTYRKFCATPRGSVSDLVRVDFTRKGLVIVVDRISLLSRWTANYDSWHREYSEPQDAKQWVPVLGIRNTAWARWQQSRFLNGLHRIFI
jgi:hypothetical protein